MMREQLILSVKNADDIMNVNYQKQHQREIWSLCFQIMTCCKCKGYEQYGIIFNHVLRFSVETLLSECVGKVNTQDGDCNH